MPDKCVKVNEQRYWKGFNNCFPEPESMTHKRPDKILKICHLLNDGIRQKYH